MSTRRRIAQIALVTSDRARSSAFYSDVFQLQYIFETSEFRGPGVDQMQGMDRVASSTSWLIDDRVGFQLEIFQFENPSSRPLPLDHCITAEGYNRLIIAVRSIDDVVDAALSRGASIQNRIDDENTEWERHLVLADPDGILIELIEAPVLLPSHRSSRIVGLGLTTLDMTTAVQDFCEGFGFHPCEDRFDPAALWQKNRTLERVQTLQLSDMCLVLSQYRDSRPRPVDYCLADIGIMNFAISFPHAEDFDNCFRKTSTMGMQPNAEPVIVDGKASVVYQNDRQGFSVEMLYMDASLRGLYGFALPSFKDKLVNKLLNWRSFWVYRRHVAESDHLCKGETQ